MLWNNEIDEGSIRIEGDVTETVVKGLTPYTNYTFCVVANNAMGNEPEECVRGVVTLEGSESICGNEIGIDNCIYIRSSGHKLFHNFECQ